MAYLEIVKDKRKDADMAPAVNKFARVASGVKGKADAGNICRSGSHVPNAVTREAIAASRAGDVAVFGSIDDLFADLNDGDDPGKAAPRARFATARPATQD